MFPPRRRSGFSLLEIVIAVSILAILAASVTPFARKYIERGKVARALGLVDTLKTACAAHHADTNEFPKEYGDGSERDLSSSQETAGWNGPYLETALLDGTANPFGGDIGLYADVADTEDLSGFDLDADGDDDVTGPCSVLALTHLAEDQARALDERLDGQLAGPWEDTGRVRWNESDQRLHVLIYY